MEHPRAARVRILGVALVVALHLGVAAWHNAAHENAGARIGGAEQAFVAVVVILAPFVALVLLWRRRWRAGGLLLGGSMTLALAYDLAQHYLLDGAGSVGHMAEGGWESAYRATALLLVLTESLALWAASWVLRRPEAGVSFMTRRQRRRRRR